MSKDDEIRDIEIDHDYMLKLIEDSKKIQEGLIDLTKGVVSLFKEGSSILTEDVPLPSLLLDGLAVCKVAIKRFIFDLEQDYKLRSCITDAMKDEY